MSAETSDFDPLVEPTLDELRLRTGAKWRKYPPDIVPVWVADMDFPVAPAVQAVLHHHSTQGDLGYASAVDDDGYRKALISWLQHHHGWTVALDDVLTVVDVLQGMAAAVAVHTDPGDGIILQTPAYPPMFRIIEEAGRVLLDNPLGPDQRLDADHLRQLAPRARAVLLCNPHNPTGRVFSAHELELLVEIAVAHDLIIISDEIHADLIHGGRTHVPAATIAGAHDRTVTLTSASKSFGMPGLSCAAAIAPPPLLDPIRNLPMGLLGHPSVIGLRAGQAAWTNGQTWLDAARRRIADNLQYASGRLTAAGLIAPVPESTYLMWIDCRPLGWVAEPAQRFLQHAQVAFSPGFDFGPPGSGFVRLNVATSRSVLELALDRAIAII